MLMNFWPMLKPMIAGQLRHMLTLAAGYLIANGALASGDQSQFVAMASGIAMWGVSAVWSLYQKNAQNNVISVMARSAPVVSAYATKAQAVKAAENWVNK